MRARQRALYPSEKPRDARCCGADRRGDHVLPTGEALSDVAVLRRPDGALAFRFTRPLHASPGVRGVNASTALAAGPTPFGWGLFPAWTVRAPTDHPVHDDMHVRWSHRPTTVDLATGASEGAAEGLGRALTAHGAYDVQCCAFQRLC